MLAYGTLAKSRFRVIRFTQPRETLQNRSSGSVDACNGPNNGYEARNFKWGYRSVSKTDIFETEAAGGTRRHQRHAASRLTSSMATAGGLLRPRRRVFSLRASGPLPGSRLS